MLLIETVYSVEKMKSAGSSLHLDNSSVHGIIFAFISSLDIDNPAASIVTSRWYGGYQLPVICAIFDNLGDRETLHWYISLVVGFDSSKCRTKLGHDDVACSNENCPLQANVGWTMETPRMETTFDLRVSLSDQTGTFSNCLLTGEVAEKMFGLTVRFMIVL